MHTSAALLLLNSLGHGTHFEIMCWQQQLSTSRATWPHTGCAVTLNIGLAKALLCSEFSTQRASVVETDTIVVSRPKVRVLERNASDGVDPTILIQFGSLYLTRLNFS